MKLRHLILLASLLATCIDAFLSSIRSWAHIGRALATERSARKQECLEESIQSLRYLTERIATRLNETDQLTPVSLPKDLSYAEGFLCRDQIVKFSADAFTSSKLQYLRRVYFSGSGYDVFNIVAIPRSNINIPILGIDIVILPGEVLASIDFQPIDQTENHDIYSLNKLKLAKWKTLLPAGGNLPEGSESFFSSHGVWTRFPRDKVKAKLLFVEQAANEFTDIYASTLQSVTERLNQPEAILREEKIEKYLRYRRESDPAKRMLYAAFGKEWTNTVLETIIFPLSYESSALKVLQ